jgi:hypothetical protein
MRTFQTFVPKFQPEFVVVSFDELSEMSAWLGQRYHHFDEISLFFETPRQSLGPLPTARKGRFVKIGERCMRPSKEHWPLLTYFP